MSDYCKKCGGQEPTTCLGCYDSDYKHSYEQLREKYGTAQEQIEELTRDRDDLQRRFNELEDAYKELKGILKDVANRFDECEYQATRGAKELRKYTD